MAVAVVAYQAGAAIATRLFPLLGATGVALLRIALAALVLAMLARPWRVALPPGSRAAVLRYGVTLGLMNVAFYAALARLPLGTAVGIEFAGPLGLALAASRHVRDVGIAALAASGLLLLITSGSGGDLHRPDPRGIGFALLAAIAWARYIIEGRRLGAVLPVGTGLALGLMVATAVVLPVGILSLGPLARNPALLGPALAVAVLSSAVPYTLELRAMRGLSTRAFGILASLDPVIAALSGLLFLGQHLPGAGLLGIACISLASVGTVLER